METDDDGTVSRDEVVVEEDNTDTDDGIERLDNEEDK